MDRALCKALKRPLDPKPLRGVLGLGSSGRFVRPERVLVLENLWLLMCAQRFS